MKKLTGRGFGARYLGARELGGDGGSGPAAPRKFSFEAPLPPLSAVPNALGSCTPNEREP